MACTSVSRGKAGSLIDDPMQRVVFQSMLSGEEPVFYNTIPSPLPKFIDDNEFPGFGGDEAASELNSGVLCGASDPLNSGVLSLDSRATEYIINGLPPLDTMVKEDSSYMKYKREGVSSQESVQTAPFSSLLIRPAGGDQYTSPASTAVQISGVVVPRHHLDDAMQDEQSNDELCPEDEKSVEPNPADENASLVKAEVMQKETSDAEKPADTCKVDDAEVETRVSTEEVRTEEDVDSPVSETLEGDGVVDAPAGDEPKADAKHQAGILETLFGCVMPEDAAAKLPTIPPEFVELALSGVMSVADCAQVHAGKVCTWAGSTAEDTGINLSA